MDWPPYPIIRTAPICAIPETVHAKTGPPISAEDPVVSKRILCWAMTGEMPAFLPDQKFWWNSEHEIEVTCKTCLEWLHA